jgi:hypothetical protein
MTPVSFFTGESMRILVPSGSPPEPGIFRWTLRNGSVLQPLCPDFGGRSERNRSPSRSNPSEPVHENRMERRRGPRVRLRLWRTGTRSGSEAVRQRRASAAGGSSSAASVASLGPGWGRRPRARARDRRRRAGRPASGIGRVRRRSGLEGVERTSLTQRARSPGSRCWWTPIPTRRGKFAYQRYAIP